MEFDAVQVLGSPGWVELRIASDHAPRLLAKIEERDGRGVVTRLVLIGDRLDAQTLRALPLNRVESVANHPLYGVGLGVTKPIDPEVLADLSRRGELFPAEVESIDQALTAFLRKVPEPDPDWEWQDDGDQVVVRGGGQAREPLTRPDGTDPDGFSRQVAAAYADAALRTSAPAKRLADEAGVPVTTVHRWVREARQRGHLPPARKGRAG